MKELLESMWNKFFNKETIDEGLKEDLWRKKYVYFAIQEFLFEETEKRNKDLSDSIVIFLKELIDTFYAIDFCDKKYSGHGAYENVYKDMKDLIWKKRVNGFYGVDVFRAKQDGC